MMPAPLKKCLHVPPCLTAGNFQRRYVELQLTMAEILSMSDKSAKSPWSKPKAG